VRHHQYGLETEENEYRHHIKAVAWAIKQTLSGQEANHFKVRIQNITVPSCRGLINFGRTFLRQVHSIEVKVNSLDQELDPIYKVLSLAANLREPLSAMMSLNFLIQTLFRK